MKKTCFAIITTAILCGCSHQPQINDWDTFEYSRVLFYNPYGGPIDRPSDLKIVKGKTEREMLEMQAAFASQSNDSTLYWLNFDSRNPEYKVSNKDTDWVLTKTVYQICDSMNHETFKHHTYLYRNVMTDTLRGLSEREALDVAEGYTKQTAGSRIFVFTATINQLNK